MGRRTDHKRERLRRNATLRAERLERRELLAAGVNMAIYEFTNHTSATPELFSTDTHAETTASDITSPLSLGWTGNGQPPNGLALGGAFNETTEPTPAGGQQDYFELTVTPDPGYVMSTARFSMQIRRNDPDSKNSYSVYFDNDPGAAGNNFATKLTSGVITSEDVFETIIVDVEGMPEFTGQTTALTFRVYAWGTVGLGTMRLDNIRVQAVQTTVSASSLAYYGNAGRLLHPLDPQGNRIADFSMAGYRNGNEPIPDLASTIDPARIVNVAPVAGDDMAVIQAAIDQVGTMSVDANGFRGIVQLSAGEFQISDQLLILDSGVLLRGVGDGDDPASSTILRGTGTTQRSIVVVGQASGFASGIANTTHNIVDKYVPVGATSLLVDSTTNWSVGDPIIVDRQSTANWISDIGMDMIPPRSDGGTVIQWEPGGNFDHLYERAITRIEGNRIFLNAPLMNSFEQQYGGGTVWRYTFPRINNVGIENIRGVSDFVGADDEAHAWTFVELQAVEDAWVSNVTGQYFGFATVHATSRAMRITVDDAQSLDPVSIVTGGRRYPFTIDGQFVLMQDLYSEDGRHDFVNNSSWRNRGPNVFLNGTAVNSNSSTGPHQRWSSGTLYDTISTDNIIEARNRGNFGTGHGWAGANMVFWNTTATQYIVQNPQTAQNWVIGSSGQIVDETRFGPQPMGTFDAHETPIDFGDPANPTSSLYVAQRNQRTSQPALEKREYVLGDFDLVSFDGSSSTDDVFVDPIWAGEVTAFAAGRTVDLFDQTTDGHLVPFSFAFGLEPDELVQAATLSLGLRGTGGNTLDDSLWLENVNDARPFSSLGLTTPLSNTQTTPVLIELTGDDLNSLNDGLVNLLVAENTAVDWAVLDLAVRDFACTAGLDVVGDYSVETFFDASTGNCERKLIYDSDQFGVVLQTPAGSITHRARPDISDPDAWGSSKQENVFVAGGDATGGNIDGVVPTAAGIEIDASGLIPSPGGQVGTWTWDGLATFDPVAMNATFEGQTDVSLTAALAADLNVGRITSNALHTHELNHGGRGDSGDLSSIDLIIGSDPPLLQTSSFPTPEMPADFPSDHATQATIDVAGNLNLTDPRRFQILKPTVQNTLLAIQPGPTVSAGWLWSASAADFSKDNVGASFLVKPANAVGITEMQFSNVSTWTIPAIPAPVGAGRFLDSGPVSGNVDNQAIARADVDGDGDLDLFLANGRIGDGEANQVLINQGGAQSGTAGQFTDSGQVLGAGESYDVALADVDGDGDPDAFVANHGANKVWVNQGGRQNGTPGQFLDSAQSLGGAESFAVALGDLDSDGDLDAFVANRDNEANRIWINQGGMQGGSEGVFADSGQLLGSIRSVDVELGDIDQDGDLDAVVANENFGPNQVWINQGRVQGGVEGEFSATHQLSHSGKAVSLADFDGDTDLDVMFANANANRLWINQGGNQAGLIGTFLDSGQSLGSSLSIALAPSDVDGDQDLDIFVGNGNENRLYLNQGGQQSGTAGLFSDSQQTFGTAGVDVAVGDFDLDNDLDLIVADGSGNHKVWLNEYFDFGDAPDTFSTSISNDGARHGIDGPRLGNQRDSEFNGQPSVDAEGDDLDVSDDEDGVMFGTIKIGNTLAAVNIDLQNAAQARVDAWLDFDGNDSWDTADQILDNVQVFAGLQTLNFNIDGSALAGDTYARIRLSTRGDLDPAGAAEDGEVEDYRVSILAAGTPTVETVEINGGAPQRSMLTEVAVTFDEEVTAPTSAFQIRQRGSGTILDTLNVSSTVNAMGKTVSTLTFGSGGNLVIDRPSGGNTLIDGNYELTIDGAQIVKVGGGPSMLADYTWGAAAADNFFRFFADQDGDRDADSTDLPLFGLTFRKNSGDAGFNPLFDFEGDNDVDTGDLIQFGQRFRQSLPFS